MSKKLLTLSFCLGALLATAQEEQEATQNKGQLNVGFESNAQWYIDDNKIQISEIDAEERIRSNSYLKLDYFIKNWEFGLQAESYTPKALLNYAPGLDKTDIGTVYARYNNTDLGLDKIGRASCRERVEMAVN